jgi:protein unc-45
MSSASPAQEVAAHAEQLAREGMELIGKGQSDLAEPKLRQAASIDESNPVVKAALGELRDADGQKLIDLCSKWLASHEDDDGEEVLHHLSRQFLNISPKAQKEAMAEMMKYSGDSDVADQITGELLKLPFARKELRDALIKSPTVTFNIIFDRGEDAMDAQTDLLLHKAMWDCEDDRIAAQRDVFQLALAQMMKPGQDFPERAMRPIARLLGAEASHLNGLLDADGFDVILTNFDIRLPRLLHSQATIACVKLLESSPENAKSLMAQYIINRIEKPTHERLIQAFSAAAALFPMAPEASAELFLTDGFLPGFVKLVAKYKSSRVEQAGLELLSAACMDKPSREAVHKYCLKWVQSIANSSTADQKKLSQANLVLQKIKDAQAEGEKKPDPDSVEQKRAQAELVSRFKSMIANPAGDGISKTNALEGLAYASIDPTVKEDLVSEPAFLKTLVKIMDDKDIGKAALFGGLSILANLTAYRPVLSEEQKKLFELKAYSQASKPAPPNPLDNDDKVTARCKDVLSVGVVSLLVTHAKYLTPTTRALAVDILNSLSKEQKHRGTLAQQGALKLLLQIYEKLSSGQPNPGPVAALTAAHAISRILISVNPIHAFASSSPPLSSAIRPLTSLLTSHIHSEGPRNLLPAFESLLALTNLASTDDSARDTIIRLAWTPLEDLLLESNTLVQRAATELVCNLCAAPNGAAKFGDGSSQAGTRLQILVALGDADDLATRRAAGGALAMLTEWDTVVTTLIARENGIPGLLRMCADDSAEVSVRGVVALRNVVCAQGDAGVSARKAMKGLDVLGPLKMAVGKGDAMVKECVAEILRGFQDGTG